MLYWALLFFALALASALLGVAGVDVQAAPLMKVSFFVFLILAVFTSIVQAARHT